MAEEQRAYVKPSHEIGISNIDLNFCVPHFYQDQFLNDADYEFSGKTFEDVNLVLGWDGLSDLILGLGGHGIRLDGEAQVLGGSIIGITEMTYCGVELCRADGISVSAKQVLDAANSRDNADDLAVLQTLFSGNGLIHLSSYDDVFHAATATRLRAARPKASCTVA